jgi:hypothetical protein
MSCLLSCSFALFRIKVNVQEEHEINMDETLAYGTTTNHASAFIFSMLFIPFILTSSI